MKLLLATRNAAKLAELRRILEAADAGVELIGLNDVPPYEELPETGLTFADNALIKAREGTRRTGLPTVADDSGIAVDAMNGMPGVFSARWSGKHGDDRANLDLLLAQLSDVDERGAQFVCAAALVLPDGREWTLDGVMRGRLIREPRGTGGFGYDPIFIAEGESLTNAELPPARKDAISHRGRAFRALAALLVGLSVDHG
ncbi:MAG TPA: RdgB/HAM1 family non-canonical purine NTP pyrophosphatase [Micromonosporaceae bacterium]|nr:RdgB/HAM1 family non-canonical purine NTP pyrophosphatase [Micromonosporaceae bacterium]